PGRRSRLQNAGGGPACGLGCHLRHQLMQEPFVVRVSKSFPVDLVTIWSHRHEGEKGAPGPGRQPRTGGKVKGRFPSGPLDRKSTRLNSSHVKISYAVFCLKKKTS